MRKARDGIMNEYLKCIITSLIMGALCYGAGRNEGTKSDILMVLAILVYCIYIYIL